MTAGRNERPGFVASVIRIFELSLGYMLWSRRSIFLAMVAGVPILLSLGIRAVVVGMSLGLPLVNGQRVSGPELFGLIVWLLYIRFIVPVLGAFYGTALIADEVDDKTITYLFTRPIPRAAVLVGKYLAFVVCTTLMVLPSIVIVYFAIVPLGQGRIGAQFMSLLSDMGMLVVGLAAYGALFAFVGARLRRPLIVGLVFAFGWEPAVLVFPGYLKRLTIAYYLQALVPHALPETSAVGLLVQTFAEVPTMTASLVCLGLIVVGMLWWAGRTVEQREYVLDQ